MLELVEPDVELRPLDIGGRVLHGRDGMRAYFEDLKASGRTLEVTAYSFTPHGDAVIVHASQRLRDTTGLAERQVYYVYTFSGDKLREVAALGTEDEALAHADARSHA